MNHDKRLHISNRALRQSRNVVQSRSYRLGSGLSQRARGLDKNEQNQYAPPETWYEPADDVKQRPTYQIVVQQPGKGYRHVVTAQQVRARLAELPSDMLIPLDVIQLSRMTRKKRSFPCYGMQWGSTLYLYPIEESLTEFYGRPPKPAQITEAKMYGGRWVHSNDCDWRLVWTEAAIRDYYLNNVLIHELGHLLDNRNSGYTDRERYAEWFAIEHGYRRSDRGDSRADRRHPRNVVRRHHKS